MATLVYFASIREALGCDCEQLTLPRGVDTVRGLVSELSKREGSWAEVLSSPILLVAINQQMSALDDGISDTDEIAFFPPVTGG